MAKPNVILIIAHDLGDNLSCYGAPVRTPNLQRLADEGVVLCSHFAAGTACSPSRGALTTGRYPHRNGLMGPVERGWALDVPKAPPFARVFGWLDYATWLFGSQHEHPDARALGYKNVVKPERGPHCDQVLPQFAEWVRAEARTAQPFFACVGFYEAQRLGLNPSHFRRDAYEPADPAKVRVPPYLPDIAEVREDLAGLYGAVGLVDRMMGQVLDALDGAKLAKDTFLIFTTDGGTSFMHAKGTLYDAGTKVACILRWPGGDVARQRFGALTSHVDLVPTVFELLGQRLPPRFVDGLQGATFAPLLYGGSTIERAYVFAERNYTECYDAARMARSHELKYIRKALRTCIYDFVAPDIEFCPSGFGQSLAMFEFYPARRCTEELYNLRNDPAEMHNVADEPSCADALAEMRSALDEHLEETDDPFLNLRNDLQPPGDGYEQMRGPRGSAAGQNA